MSDAKKARRDHARELARQTREAERKRKIRNRTIIIAISSIGGLGIIALIVVLAVSIASSLAPAAPVPGPANMASNGILMTGDGTTVSAVTTDATAAGEDPTPTDPTDYPGTVNVVAYVDYMCPFCGQFEAANGDYLMDLVRSGKITLETHPISFLDSQSQGTEYSSRAASAAACVAANQPDAFLDVNKAFYDNQPEEGSSGLSDDELLGLMADVGVDSAAITTCVNEGEFAQWSRDAYDLLMSDGVPNSDNPQFSGTPFVTIDGVQYTGAPSDGAAFQKLVTDAIAAKG